MTELWVVQEQQLAFAILATQYHVGSPCWSPGSLLPCRAESPQFSCSFQIPPLVSPFPLTSLLCTFTSPYNSVRGVCHFPCAHRHTIAPLFTWLYLHHPYLQHWSTINIFHGQTTKDWGIQIQVYFFPPELKQFLLFWARVSAFAHMYVTTYTHASSSWMQPLNKAWGSVSVKGLCHTLWVSHYLLVSVLNHLFYRITPSSVSPLLFHPPVPFTGPKPAVQELFLFPFAHLEQNTHKAR